MLLWFDHFNLINPEHFLGFGASLNYMVFAFTYVLKSYNYFFVVAHCTQKHSEKSGSISNEIIQFQVSKILWNHYGTTKSELKENCLHYTISIVVVFRNHRHLERLKLGILLLAKILPTLGFPSMKSSQTSTLSDSLYLWNIKYIVSLCVITKYDIFHVNSHIVGAIDYWNVPLS